MEVDHILLLTASHCGGQSTVTKSLCLLSSVLSSISLPPLTAAPAHNISFKLTTDVFLPLARPWRWPVASVSPSHSTALHC